MLLLYIDGIDRTGDLQRETLRKTNQIQQRADNMSFTLFKGVAPQENQNVRFFVGDTIASAAGAVMTLNGYFERGVSQFFPGQVLFIRIGDSDEEKCTVSTYDETTLTLTLTAAPSGSVVAGDKIGELRFGGTVAAPEDRNVEVLANLEYDITVVDYTKFFDHAAISDTWQSVDSRYIINSFVNSTVNYNLLIDNLSYASNATLQAAWGVSFDGSTRTIDASDFMEGTSSAVFAWTHSGGTAHFFNSGSYGADYSEFSGVTSGRATQGSFSFWIKAADYTKITSGIIALQSTSGNTVSLPLQPITSNEWQQQNLQLKKGTYAGTINWTNINDLVLILTESGSSSVKLNGFRLNAENSFTLNNVTSTPIFSDIRAPQLKPSAMMQVLAKAWDYVWYIDYERDIHFVAAENVPAPFALTDSSNNFTDLKRRVDQTQLGNRVIVRGGEKTSTSTYAQVIPGDNSKREWILKNKFNNLVVRIDDNSLTNAAAAGTTTTNIKIVGHGFSTGDHIINRTRSNAVREITVVDADNFTVATVTGQTSGDTISHFKTAATSGVEGLVDESTVDYVYNSNEKSVRASTQTATLSATSFIRFAYNERIPIQVQYANNASVSALKALGFADGVFDLNPIVDKNIQDTNTAVAIAQAKVDTYCNPIITGSFKTDQNGLRAGQIISIQDSVRGLDTDYVIQSVRATQDGGEFSDYFIYDVEFGTTLFGFIEFYQKLLATKDAIESNVDDVVDTFVTGDEDMTTDDSDNVAAAGGFKTATENEDVTTDDGAGNVVDFPAGTWQFEPSTGQPLATRFDLADFG